MKIRLDSMSNVAVPSANCRFAFVLRCVCCSVEKNDYSELLFIISSNYNSNYNSNNNSSCCKLEMRVLSFHISNNSFLSWFHKLKENEFLLLFLLDEYWMMASVVVVVFYCLGWCSWCCWCWCEGVREPPILCQHSIIRQSVWMPDVIKGVHKIYKNFYFNKIPRWNVRLQTSVITIPRQLAWCSKTRKKFFSAVNFLTSAREVEYRKVFHTFLQNSIRDQIWKKNRRTLNFFRKIFFELNWMVGFLIYNILFYHKIVSNQFNLSPSLIVKRSILSS